LLGDGVAELKVSGGVGERDWVEIRLLGPLRVWRADGSSVQDREWRTTKNADLLRWLALNAGDPVPVEALLVGLWPEVDDARARASLRTAVSHLRKVLGGDAVTRDASEVTLVDAWVDATAFVDHVEEVEWRRHDGLLAEALAAAREADALYMADVAAVDGAPSAIVQHAGVLSAKHRRLLEHAAELSVALGWMRDAVNYATRLLEADPVSELATRTLMLGHAGLGEQHHALRAYERCRTVLAEELGVDPSPQTQAVHLQVLRAPTATHTSPSLVGRDNEVRWLRAVLEEAMSLDAGRARVVLLAGHEGSGRRRLASEACQDAGLELHDVGSRPELIGEGEGDAVFLWQPDMSRDLGLVRRLLLAPDTVAGSHVVVLLVPMPGTDAEWDLVSRGEVSACLELKPLLPADVAQLASQLLGGPVTTGLVDELIHLSGGLPGGVSAAVRHWAGAGRLLATSTGLALAPMTGGTDGDQAVRRTLARALPRLEGDPYDALLLTAVLDRPVTPSLLETLLSEDGRPRRARATAALEKLVDVGLLRFSTAGAVWRHPLMRDAAYAWMRPAVRRRTHLRIAEQAPIPPEARIQHWLAGGERELACLAALEAAERCSARGDHAAARTHLLEVCSLGDLPESSAVDRVDLFERLGDACALVRRPDEARTAYAQALDIARDHALPDHVRLLRKVEAAANPRALDQAVAHQLPGFSLMAGTPVVAGESPDAALETALLETVARADEKGDRDLRVRARLHLAGGVYLPRREFPELDRWVGEALGLSPSSADTLRAHLLRLAPQVLLGGAWAVGEALEDASATAEGAGEDGLWWRLLGMRLIVAHDLGAPAFEQLWPRLRDRVMTGPVDPIVPELATVGLRVMVERGLLDPAAAMAHHLSFAGGQPTTLMEHQSRIALAELAEASLEPRRAAQLLRSVVEEGVATGCTLLVPEAAARFVVLEAGHDVAAAHGALDLHRQLLGDEHGLPRERFWGMLAQSAVMGAQGDGRGAASTCQDAAALAADHGLEFLVLRARERHSFCVQASLPRQAGSQGGTDDGGVSATTW
jgi:DNA-binding SARP family transcriptional activator